MTKEDIFRLRDTAEQTRVQFFDERNGIAERKERVTRDNKYDVSCEMVAQSNSRGGMIVVTVERRNVEGNDRVDYRDSDRIDRDKRDRDDRDDVIETQHVSYKMLNGVQKNVIQFCSIPRSAREILEHIRYAYNSTNIANQIKSLVQLGFLEMTEPDKPNSKNQKYRKVRKK